MELVGVLLHLLAALIFWVLVAVVALVAAAAGILVASLLVARIRDRWEQRHDPSLAHRLRLCEKARLGYRCSATSPRGCRGEE